MVKQEVLLLDSRDNVGVALLPLPRGTVVTVRGESVVVADDLAAGHKLALRGIDRGRAVLKYGHPIGLATSAIQAGQWVHTHNVAVEPLEGSCAYSSEVPAAPRPLEGRTFPGYRRADGRAGTRNYVVVISSVNCSASVSKAIARRIDATMLGHYGNIDGVVALTHESGCGMSFGGQQHELLNRVLAGMARHPNVGGFLLVGLGCEQGALDYLIESQRLVTIGGTTRPGPVPVLSMQLSGGTVKTVEAGVELLAQLLPQANDVQRTEIPASELVVGLECGGSDAWSGVTANPAVGVASDMIVACGGTAILSEVPEIFGAEGLLTRRARSPEIAQKLMDRIAWWQRYTSALGARLDNNPTVGNKEGGLTTIYEKSLGAVAKAGSTALEDVYCYAERVAARGLVVMDTPGYDPVSVTGMMAGGANVIVFTTGRGSCYGCKPVPSIKVVSNTATYERMIDDMDINAGRVLEGSSVAAVGQEIFEEILAVAGGRRTKSERHGIGEEEFVPWNVGPTL